MRVQKHQSSGDLFFYQTPPCNPTPKELKSCNHYRLLGLFMYFQKSHGLLLLFFTKEAVIENKQACQVLQY